jgi:hypothetical protein
LDVLGASEVVAIVGFVEPSALAVGLAGFAAFGLGAVALALRIAIVGNEEHLAVLTLTFSLGMSHGPESPQAYDLGDGGGKKAEEGRKRDAKKMEESGLRSDVGEEDGRGESTI